MKDEATQVHPAQYTKAYSIKISRNTYKTRSSMKWYFIQLPAVERLQPVLQKKAPLI